MFYWKTFIICLFCLCRSFICLDESCSIIFILVWLWWWFVGFFSFSLSNKCPLLEIKPQLKPQKVQKDPVRYILIEGQPGASFVLDFLDVLNEKLQVELLLCGLQLHLSNCWLCASLTSGSYLPTPLSDLCSSCARPRNLSKTCAWKIT